MADPCGESDQINHLEWCQTISLDIYIYIYAHYYHNHCRHYIYRLYHYHHPSATKRWSTVLHIQQVNDFSTKSSSQNRQSLVSSLSKRFAAGFIGWWWPSFFSRKGMPWCSRKLILGTQWFWGDLFFFFETDTYWLNLIPFRDAILISLVSHSSQQICFKKQHFQTIADALRLDVLHLVRIPVLPGKHWFNLYGSAILVSDFVRFCFVYSFGKTWGIWSMDTCFPKFLLMVFGVGEIWWRRRRRRRRRRRWWWWWWWAPELFLNWTCYRRWHPVLLG